MDLNFTTHFITRALSRTQFPPIIQLQPLSLNKHPCHLAIMSESSLGDDTNTGNPDRTHETFRQVPRSVVATHTHTHRKSQALSIMHSVWRDVLLKVKRARAERERERYGIGNHYYLTSPWHFPQRSGTSKDSKLVAAPLGLLLFQTGSYSQLV